MQSQVAAGKEAQDRSVEDRRRSGRNGQAGVDRDDLARSDGARQGPGMDRRARQGAGDGWTASERNGKAGVGVGRREGTGTPATGLLRIGAAGVERSGEGWMSRRGGRGRAWTDPERVDSRRGA